MLRYRAQLLQNASGKSGNAELEAVEVIDGLDFPAEPAAHLTAGISREQGDDVVVLVELVEHFLAAAKRIPSLVQPLVRPEGDRGPEAEGRILAKIVIRCRMPHLDSAGLHGIEDLQVRNHFAGAKR